MNYVSLYTIKYLLDEFQKNLEGYHIDEYVINEYEKVLLVEDSLVLYCGILESTMPVCLNAEECYQDRKYNPFLNIPVEGEIYYELFIEELTYNSLGWKYNHSGFLRKMQEKIGIDHLLDVHYAKFRGYARLYWCPEQETLCEQIEKILPELRLRERYEAWEGIKYYLIVLEMPDMSGTTHYGVAYTTQKPHSYIVSKCTESIKKGFRFGEIRMHRQALKEAFDSWKGVKRQIRFEKYFKYFYFEKYFREKDDVWRYADKILERAYNNEFQDEERSTYTRPVNKWKSEETVFNMTKKLYKQYKVIYQHRPFFLRNPNGGQMSYDIYISELKVAIEYQGKQHFEPVDFFGGEEGYEKTVERDKIKQALSKRNGVRLVYINYWEEITSQLIRERVEQFL